MNIEKLNLDIRTFNAFKRAGINTVEEYLDYPDKDKLKSLVGEKKFANFVNSYSLPALGDYLRHKEEQLKNEYIKF